MNAMKNERMKVQDLVAKGLFVVTRSTVIPGLVPAAAHYEVASSHATHEEAYMAAEDYDTVNTDRNVSFGIVGQFVG